VCACNKNKSKRGGETCWEKLKWGNNPDGGLKLRGNF